MALTLSITLESYISGHIVQIDDAVVDQQARRLWLPSRLIHELGLHYMQTREVSTGRGTVRCNLYAAVILTIRGRQGTIDVAELPADEPPLVGSIPLSMLDLEIDANGQLVEREQIIDLLVMSALTS